MSIAPADVSKMLARLTRIGTCRRPMAATFEPSERIEFLLQRDGPAAAQVWVERALSVYREPCATSAEGKPAPPDSERSPGDPEAVARPLALPNQDHFVGGGLSTRQPLARPCPTVGSSACAAEEEIAIEGPRTLRIARVQSVALHPPFTVFLDRNRCLDRYGGGSMAELLGVAARQVRIAVYLVQASPGRRAIRPLREVAVILRRAPLGPWHVIHIDRLPGGVCPPD